MKLRTLDDGTLLIEERLTMVRWAAALGAMGLVGAFVFTQQTRGPLSGREVLGGAAGFLALLGIAAAVADRSFHFDRGASRLRWKVQYLFATRTGEVPFEDVIKVSLLTSTEVDDPHRHPVYLPILITRERPLTLSSFFSRDPEMAEALAQSVSRALGRPHQPAREATVEELVAADRILEAVKQVRRRAAVRGGAPMGLAEARAIVEQYRLGAGAEPANDGEERRAA